jgi:hypothetical protein
MCTSLAVPGGGFAQWLTDAPRRCPCHRELIAPGDQLEAISDALPDPPEALLVGSLRAQRQEARHLGRTSATLLM